MDYNIDEEVWKDVEGYENIYTISSKGRVWNKKRRLYMKPKNNKGYHLVGLTKERKQKWFSVHRLVAIAFIENPHNKREVNHLDENKTNNTVNNIRWATSKENANWGTRIERIVTTNKKKKNSDVASVLQVCPETGKVVAEYKYASEASKETGVEHSGISRCLSGKQEKAMGFNWIYKAE